MNSRAGWTGYSAAVYVLTSRVAAAVYLQAMWVVHTLAGGVVLGVSPALFSLLIAARREGQGERVAFTSAWRDYTHFFWRANLLGGASAGLLAIAAANLLWLWPDADAVPRCAMLAGAFWVVYILCNLWVRVAAMQVISVAATWGAIISTFRYPVRSLAVVAIAVAAAALAIALPALGLAVGLSAPAILVMHPRMQPTSRG